MSNEADELIEEGRTVFRKAHADNAAVIVCGAAYFLALREAMLAARESIHIVGWDIDGRTDLWPGREEADDDGWPTRFGELVAELRKRRPEVSIRILQWDFSMFYVAEREFPLGWNNGWRASDGLDYRLDAKLPAAAAHHQKLVSIDGAFAFCGGLDITLDRWDTRAHPAEDERRRRPDGSPYEPFHDLQWALDGEAARAICDVIGQRWNNATGEDLPGADSGADASAIWPASVEPDFENVEVGIARTMPALNGDPPVTEIEALALATIARAERLLYIENQYFTSDAITDALCDRLREVPELAVIVVNPERPRGFLERLSMCGGRMRAVDQLRECGVAHRVRFAHPVTRHRKNVGDGKADDDHVPIFVHAKLTIADDRTLRIGSANLNNRSFGFDSECDVVLHAAEDDDETRSRIARLRDRALGEHLDISAEAAARITQADDPIAALDDAMAQQNGHRRLLLIDDKQEFDTPLCHALALVADPERPGDMAALTSGVGNVLSAADVDDGADQDDTGDDGKPRKRDRLLARLRRARRPNETEFAAAALGIRLGGIALALGVIAAVFHWTELGTWLGLGDATSAPRQLVAGTTELILVPLAFVGSGLLMLPLGPLIALAGFIYGWSSGAVLGIAGAAANALVLYAAGRRVKSRILRRVLSARMHRIMKRTARRGFMGVAAIRVLPVAPYSAVNIAAGAAGVPLPQFLLGTLLAMAPGAACLALIGDRLHALWASPGWETALGLAGAGLLLAALTFAIPQIARLVPARDGAEPAAGGSH